MSQQSVGIFVVCVSFTLVVHVSSDKYLHFAFHDFFILFF